jgi:hypothetical protein
LGVAEENNVQQVWICGLLQEQPAKSRYRYINSYDTKAMQNSVKVTWFCFFFVKNRM